MINPQDELRHPANNDSENWSESYYFSFTDIPNRISGFFRIGLEENRRQSNVWCSLFHDGKVIYQRFQFHLPYSDADIGNIQVGGVHFAMTEPMQTFTIGFSDRQLQVDLMWRGLHDVIDMHKAMGRLSSSLATGHHEQSGAVEGKVSIDGKVINVNGFGFRDHSWGIRNWEGVRNWKTCAGQFGAEFAFHAAVINELDGAQFHLGLAYKNHEIVLVDRVDIVIDDLVSPREGLLTMEFKGGEKTTIDIVYSPTQICHIPRDFNVVQECHVVLKQNGNIGSGFSEINRSLLYS